MSRASYKYEGYERYISVTTSPRITSRPYAGEHDLLSMKDFLVAASADDLHGIYWHIGNLLWSRHFATGDDLRRDVRLWEDDAGALLGFAWFEGSGSLDVQVHPRFHGRGVIEEQMLDWGARRIAGSGRPADEWKLSVPAVEGDSRRIELLARHGFERDPSGLHMVLLRRSLERPVPGPALPEGWAVRHVADEREFGERVEAHRDAWHPSGITRDKYELLRSLPGYLPELDIIAAVPDGTFASCCVCWLDPVNGRGLYEPVSTRPAFRRKGLGKAVMIEGLRRLKTLGAREAMVWTNAGNEPAIKLYESVGFRISAHEHRYVRSLPS
jgi:mycothiol synthase